MAMPARPLDSSTGCIRYGLRLSHQEHVQGTCGRRRQLRHIQAGYCRPQLQCVTSSDICVARGDLPEHVAEAYETQKQAVEALQRPLAALAEQLNAQLPSLPESDAQRTSDHGISIIVPKVVLCMTPLCMAPGLQLQQHAGLRGCSNLAS